MIRIGASIIALGMICNFPVSAHAAEYHEYSLQADVMTCDTRMEVPTLGLRKQTVHYRPGPSMTAGPMGRTRQAPNQCHSSKGTQVSASCGTRPAR